MVMNLLKADNICKIVKKYIDIYANIKLGCGVRNLRIYLLIW